MNHAYRYNQRISDTRQKYHRVCGPCAVRVQSEMLGNRVGEEYTVSLPPI